MAIESLLEIEADGQGFIADPANTASGGLTVYGFDFERFRSADTNTLGGHALTCRLGAGQWVPQLLSAHEYNENLSVTLHTYGTDEEGNEVPELTWYLEGGRIEFVRFEQPDTRYTETASLDHMVHLTIAYHTLTLTWVATGVEAQVQAAR